MESCFYCLVNKIYRGKNGSIESRIFLVNIETKSVALVYGAKRNGYSFPKGHKEDDGTLKQCAIRETAEETRRVGEIEMNLNHISRDTQLLVGRIVHVIFILLLIMVLVIIPARIRMKHIGYHLMRLKRSYLILI